MHMHLWLNLQFCLSCQQFQAHRTLLCIEHTVTVCLVSISLSIICLWYLKSLSECLYSQYAYLHTVQSFLCVSICRVIDVTVKHWMSHSHKPLLRHACSGRQLGSPSHYIHCSNTLLKTKQYSMGFSSVSLPQCHNRKTGGDTVVQGKVTEERAAWRTSWQYGLKWPLLICQWSLQKSLKSLFHGPFHVQMIEEAQETINISRRFGRCH